MKHSCRIEERLRNSAERLIDLMGNNVDERMQEAVEAMLEAADEIRTCGNARMGPAEYIMAGITSCKPKTENAASESCIEVDRYAIETASVSDDLDDLDDWADSIAYSSMASACAMDDANGAIRRSMDRAGGEIGGRTT